MQKGAILIFLIFLSFNLLAKKEFYKAELHFTNGDLKSGYAELIVPSHSPKIVAYKDGLKDEPIKIDTEELSMLIYKFDNGNVRTFERLKVYRGAKQKITKDSYWLERIIEGYTSLYVVPTPLRGTNPYSGATMTNMFYDYYCLKKGDIAARMIGSEGNNTTFKKRAQLYFSDYEELVNKIKNKEYKWKDIEQVVESYNEWKSSQNK